jgi:hypothetical protein
MPMRRAFVVLILLACSGPARAAGEVDDLIAAYDSKERLKKEYAIIHADLIQRGIAVANRALVLNNQTPLYCPPPTLVLTGEQILDMLRRQAQESPPFGALSTDNGILSVLRRTFRCDH